MIETADIFIKRFLAFLVGPVVSSGISFLIVPLTTWLVVPAEFGKASMYTLMVSLLGLVVYLGLDQAFVREFHASKERGKLLINCAFFPLLLSLGCSVIALLCYKQLSMLLFGAVYLFPIVCFAISFPFVIFERFNFLIIRMEERAKLYSSIIIFRQSIRVPLLLFFLFIWKDFRGIILAESLAQVLVVAISTYFVRGYWSFNFDVSSSKLQSLLRYGLPLIPTSILMWLFTAMDKIALRVWSSYAELGIYSSAFKIVGVLSILNGAFCTFWVPTAYRWFEAGESPDKFEKVGRYLCLGLCVVASMLILGRNVIVLVLSQNYASSAAVMPFLVFSPIMYMLSEVSGVGTNFLRRTEFHILSTGLSFVVNLVGNYLLVPRYGAVGAGISTGVSYIVFFWTRTLIARKLWVRFRIKFYAVNIFLLFASACSTLLPSVKIGYLGSVLILLLILVCNLVTLRNGLEILKKYGGRFWPARQK